MSNSKVKTTRCSPFFLQEIAGQEISFDRSDYDPRIDALVESAKKAGLTHVAIYGDREHFATIDYFSGYDCRFEEALLVFDMDRNASILVGNEGISQTYPIPYPVNVYLYQNFSLPGQPRDEQEQLPVIFRKIGITAQSRVGMVGYKYFEREYIDADPEHTFDVPAYILAELYKVCAEENVVNFTKAVIGYPDGIRLKIRSAKEIARIECAGNRVASTVLRMLKKLKPGISERELAFATAGLEATNVHPMVNFGTEKVRIGVHSPTDKRLEIGEVCGICYSQRYNLTSRVGVAAYCENTVANELCGHLDFYKAAWNAVADVTAVLRVGVRCSDIHNAAMNHIGAPEYNVKLNITHYTGADEWLNSSVYKDSPHTIGDGAHLQLDMIASSPDPVMTAICEDSVVIAGEQLRAQLNEEYPQVYNRIVMRQKMIRAELGINIHDDVMPMSNLNGVCFPYMLDLGQIYTLK